MLNELMRAETAAVGASRIHDDLIHCEYRIGEEEKLAEAASSPEAACLHQQMAMLYRSQRAALKVRLAQAASEPTS